MVLDPDRRAWPQICVAACLLALPALGVHAWVASTFPSYLHGAFGQDVVFAFAWCGLLACIAHRRLLHLASVPLALLAYLAWLFLVLGEGVSYYLQADTFNARFFAHLNLDDFHAGVHAYPAMIGGGVALIALMVIVGASLLVWVRAGGRPGRAVVRGGPLVVALAILVLSVVGLDSAPRRLLAYLTHVQQSAHFADTAQGRAVARLLDLDPVSKKRLIAAPGKNVVWIYLESLERIYWSPKVFPGLTPNLDRLRGEGLDFSGFQTFSGASYTIAGMFASQCGAPLFTSPFAGLDVIAGNDTDTSSFHPKIVCFGDVLHEAGYTQVYLGGAPISFSNKGLFYRLHGFNEALGLRQLEAGADGKLAESGWGLYDSVLFPLALRHYERLEAARKPFNLSMITLDTHPPDGRPSPGCPRYTRSDNSMLQAVHCTDYLVGKFVDALSKLPNWKNTVVVIMSDHLMMRNDAEPLYPETYQRRPSLLVLNAGTGVRPVRMYHMDVAPTLLNLMGVRTNATFIAGEDRSAPAAAGSPLVDNDVTDAVLRKALWSRVNEFRLCKRSTLVKAISDSDFDVGGRELSMSSQGVREVGIHAGQALDFFIDNANAKLVIADSDRQAALLAARGDASVLIIRPRAGDDAVDRGFSVDWLGRLGARAHLATVPSLRGLNIRSADCDAAIHKADVAPAGSTLNLSQAFESTVAPAPGLAPGGTVDFSTPEAAALESGFGWSVPQPWGSWSIGSMAGLRFGLQGDACRRGAALRLQVDPYLPPSRSKLVTEVWVNGKLATTWRFDARGVYSTGTQGASDDHRVETVTAPMPAGPACEADVQLRFSRPDAGPAPYPASEDPRPLQLRLLRLSLEPAGEGRTPSQAGK
jgi:hypothetical protein